MFGFKVHLMVFVRTIYLIWEKKNHIFKEYMVELLGRNKNLSTQSDQINKIRKNTLQMGSIEVPCGRSARPPFRLSA
jgi:hypothetical protein